MTLDHQLVGVVRLGEAERVERDGAGLFFAVINARYENGHPTLATTTLSALNQPWRES
ncbi:MAG: hypothetical protein M0Z63_11020 [Actinomycetota bacterium]|jgi:hypothetical protein|nr:hypothetical protein [Actinomycetota bacterium]